MSRMLSVGMVVEIIPTWYYNNQVGLNVHHMLVQSVAGAMSDLDLAYAAMETPVGGNPISDQYRDIVGPDASLLGASAQIIYPDRYVIQSWTVGAGIGTDIGNQLPSQVAGLVSKYGQEATRRARGRNYYPFPTDNALFGGTADGPGPIYVQKCVDIATFFMGNPLGTIWNGITSGDEANLVEIVFNLTSPITSNVVNRVVGRPYWATQRRRGDFGRTNLPPF